MRGRDGYRFEALEPYGFMVSLQSRQDGESECRSSKLGSNGLAEMNCAVDQDSLFAFG
jgi:hypothetical protein